MKANDWKSRLIAGIEAKGKSQREVSLAAGRGPGYVNSLLKEGKEPTIDNIIQVCHAADLSPAWVLFGFDMTKETQEIVEELEAGPPERRKALIELLRAGKQLADPSSHDPS